MVFSPRQQTITVISILLIAAVVGLSLPGSAVASASSYSLTQTKSGLVHLDPLTSNKIDTSYWTFSGDAQNIPGAKYGYYESSSGLFIYVSTPSDNAYSGFYAVTPNSNVMLFHATLSVMNLTSTHDYNTGLYVQTFQSVSYIFCGADVTSSGYYWIAAETTGNSQGITTYTELYRSSVNDGHLTRECTVVTDGANYLKIYIDNTAVYSSTSAGLNMPPPFQAYLEVETSSSSKNTPYWGKYTDYYDTISDVVTLQNVPPGYTAQLISGSNVLASAKNGGGSSASVTLGVAQYHLPLSATLQLLDTSNNVVGSTGSKSFWSGDIYTAALTTSSSTSSSSTTSLTSVLSVNSENSIGNPITGYKMVLLSQSGVKISSQNTPASFTLNNGQTYNLKAVSARPCTFDHWAGGPIDGKTSNPVVITINGPTIVSAVFTGNNCGPQSTTTSTTTSSSSSSSRSSTTTMSTTSSSSSTSDSSSTSSSSSSSSRSSSTTTSTSSSSSSSRTTTTSSSTSSVSSVTNVQLTIDTQNSAGTAISGYFTILDHNGNLVKEGYSPITFTVKSGVTYTVTVDNYGSCSFSHWLDNNSPSDPRTVSITTDTTLTAIYTCT